MKNLFAVTFLAVLAAASVALFSCNNSKSGKGLLDPTAMISLRAAEDVRSNATSESSQHLSTKEIVKQTTIISFWHTNNRDNACERGFDDAQRDIANNRLLMASTDIIDVLGNLVPDFIESYDFLFVIFDKHNHPIDTIAYIPNAILRKAEQEIKAAYAKDDYTTCYNLFDKAFVFRPITGEEWRALKAKNRN